MYTCQGFRGDAREFARRCGNARRRADLFWVSRVRGALRRDERERSGIYEDLRGGYGIFVECSGELRGYGGACALAALRVKESVWYARGFAGALGNGWGCAGTCMVVREGAEMFADVRGFVGMRGDVRGCAGMRASAQGCMGFYGDVQACSGIFGGVRGWEFVMCGIAMECAGIAGISRERAVTCGDVR